MANFKRIDDLDEIEKIGARTRVCTGTGTSFLAAPGLITLERLRIGPNDMPLSEKRKYPSDTTGFNFREVDEPLVELQTRSDGTPFIVRADISNDGIWVNGEPVYVTGEWADDSTDSADEFPGLSKAVVKILTDEIGTADDVRAASDDQLAALNGISSATVDKIRKSLASTE